MGVEGHESAKTAKQQLAQLLRSWWEQDPGKITQEALARRITQRGVRTSQEMLSRYLNRTRPTLARPDLIRAMHEVLGRAPEELAQALALHGKARASTSPGRVPALPPPQGWEGSPCVTVPDGSLHTASEGTLSEMAPDSSLPVTAPVSGQDTGPAGSRPRRPWILFASAVAVGAAVLTAAATLKGGEGRGEGETPVRSAMPTQSLTAGPIPTAHCRDESCFGIDPKYAICKEDAATYYTGTAHSVLVELRFSPTCQAAWAKMSGTSQGDVVRVTNNAGRSRHYTQQWGRDAHTTMVEARNPDDATACARTPRGEVCATKPATPSTAPTPGLG